MAIFAHEREREKETDLEKVVNGPQAENSELYNVLKIA